MTISVGESSTALSSGRKWYAYSGVVAGGGGVPAFITLLNLPDTGLRDSFVKVMPFYSFPIAFAPGSALGIEVTIDGIVVLRSQANDIIYQHDESYELFVPKQSSLLIESRNTAANNGQERGCNLIGWYL
tara:strand:+ start:2597 stop:2986 length:390 start_codon:yes stop_codon:yes gene_type:complete